MSEARPQPVSFRILSFLFLFGFSIRLGLSLHHDGLWLDEALTGWRTQTFASIFQYEKPVPPFYYLLVWLSRQLFGDAALGLRMPSLLCGALLAPTLTYFLSKHFGHRFGLSVGLLAALNGYSLYYSYEARCYALATLLGVIHAAVCWEILLAPKVSKTQFVAFGVSGVLLSYTHNWGLLLMGAVFWSLICRMALDREARARLLKGILAAYGVIGGLYLLYLPTLLTAASETGSMGPLWPKAPLSTVTFSILGAFLTGSVEPFAILFAAGSLAILSFSQPFRSATSFWGWTAIFCLLNALLLQLKLPLFLAGRYDSVFLGIFLTAVALACRAVPESWPRRVVWIVLLGFILLGASSVLTGAPKSSSKELADLVRRYNPELTLVALTHRFDPLLPVALGYEFEVLHGSRREVLETPKFIPLQYGYVYIPDCYREGPALQSIPADQIAKSAEAACSPYSRVALIGPPEELAVLRQGLGGAWRETAAFEFSSTTEGVSRFVLLQRTK